MRCVCQWCGCSFHRRRNGDRQHRFCSSACFGKSVSAAAAEKRLERETPEAFIERTEPEPNSGCWLWTGSRSTAGYGNIKWGGETRLVHILSHELFVGPVPRGLCVCHRCDNPSCVNPDHFFLGTKADNNRDRDRKGRGNFGERNAHARITRDDVVEIRRRLASGERDADVASDFGVSPRHARSIGSGADWSWIPRDDARVYECVVCGSRWCRAPWAGGNQPKACSAACRREQRRQYRRRYEREQRARRRAQEERESA